MLIQQNVDGSDFFNRSWAEFKVGFDSTNGNYWFGNDRLSQLTQSGPYKLRFDLQSRRNSSWFWAEYSRVIVFGESSNYTLQVSGFSSNIGGDPFGSRSQNGLMFSTYDRDNDESAIDYIDDNCALLIGGGFWYSWCGRGRVNGVRGDGERENFSWYSTNLRTSRMWLTC